MAWKNCCQTLSVKVLLPLCLGTCAFLRQNVFSFAYLVFFFCIPFWNAKPTGDGIKAGLGVVLMATTVWAALVQFSQGFFQIICFFFKDDFTLTYCEPLERLLRHIGLIDWGSWPPADIVISIVPDTVIMIVSVGAYRSYVRDLKKLPKTFFNPIQNIKKYELFLAFGRAAVTVLLMGVAIINPSPLGLVYFALALVTGLVVACRKKTLFIVPVLVLLLIVIVANIIVIFVVQMQWFQEEIPREFLELGQFEAVLGWKCSMPYEHYFLIQSWEPYCIGPLLLCLYACSAALLRHTFLSEKLRRKRGRHLWELIIERVTVAGAAGVMATPGTRKSKFWKAITSMNYHKFLNEAVTFLACSCMLIWSVVYVGWTSLVLLVWAASLCLFPKMKVRTLASAPPLVFYAYFLLVVHYLYSMPNVAAYLRRFINSEYGIDGGFDTTTGLVIKSILTFFFLLLLRQYLNMRRFKKRPKIKKEPDEEGSIHEVFLTSILRRVRFYFVLTWILVVISTVLIFICTGSQVNILRVIYVFLFVFFILIFQFSYDGWRNLLANYWFSLGTLTLLALILEYTHSFKFIRKLWTDLGIHENLQSKIGFESKDPEETRLTLLKLTVILIAVMVQIQLNDEFLEETNVRKKVKGDFSREGMEDIIKSTMKHESEKVNMIFRVILTLHKIVVFLLDVIQLHMTKILIIIFALLVVEHVTALHWLLLAVVLSSLCVRQRLRLFVIRVCTVLVAAHTIQWMLLDLVDERDEKIVCTQVIFRNFSEPSVTVNYTRGLLEWWGFLLVEPSQEYTSSTIVYHMVVVMISTVAIAVNRFMLYKGFLRGEMMRQVYVLFPGVRRADADYNMIQCAKFLTNYAFYKFGLEICFIAMTIQVGLRWDIYSIILLMWIFALFSCERKTIRHMWPFLVYYMYFCILIQYAFILDLPPEICLAYPWFTSRRWRVVQDWLSLPEPFLQIKSRHIIYDVVILLLLSRQKVVFSIEKKYGSNYPGGSNDRIRSDSDNPFFINPVPDFVTFIRSWLDILKHYYFPMIYWMTLIVIFLTSSLQVNVFSIGYLIASFIMFWRGEDFYLFATHHMCRQWNFLIAYNLMVMFTKTALQFAANMLVDSYGEYYCILLSAMSLRPDAHPGREAELTGAIANDKICTYSFQPVIAWDIVCFAFLIISRRAFLSYYFIHIVNDAKATMVISSRGALIFDQIFLHEIAIQAEKEKETIENLWKKMAMLRLKQMKLQMNPLFVSPASHYDAIRAGDYFMFDEREMQEEDEQRLAEEARMHRRKAIRASRPNVFIRDAEKDSRRSTRALAFRDQRPGGADEDDDDDEQGSDDDQSKKDERVLTLQELLEKTRSQTIEETVKDVQRSRHSGVTVADMESTEPVEEQKESQKKTRCAKCESYFLWLYYLVDSGVMSLALTMYGYTKNYRFVVNELRKEKKVLLVRGSLQGYRVKSSSQWTPYVTYSGLLSKEEDTSFSDVLNDHGIQAALQNTAEKAQEEFFKMSHRSSYFSLFTSILYLILAYTELVCYMLIVLHQLLEPTMISLIMTTSMYLWATLSTPRPVKTYWVTLMAYIEIVIVIKTVVQFPSFTEITEFKGEKIFNEFEVIGLPLHRTTTTTMLSLFLFISILFHRYRLKKFGLWEDSRKEPWQNVSERRSPYYSMKTVKVQGSDTKETIYISGTPSQIRKEKPEGITTYMPHIFILPLIKYRTIFTLFFTELLTSPIRYHVDVYAWMFLLDAVCFIITIFGISHFGVLYRDWYWYFDRNRFPLSIFSLLFGQFFLIVIDRIIYVRKNILAKLIFHIVNVVIIHVYLFIFLPLSEYRKLNDSSVLQAYYVIKCMYFLVSAYQIRNGYAIYEHGYLFRKKFGIFYMIFHRLYMNAPFFFEMRTIIDWVASDTTFTFFEFFKMEDVYNYAYSVKCNRSYEKSYPKPRGSPNTLCAKVFVGGSILLFLILLIWFPLILFQLRHELGIPRQPVVARVELVMDMFPPLYSDKSYSVRKFTESEWRVLSRIYKNEPRAQDSMRYFDNKDIVVIQLPLESLIWTVPSETRNLMAEHLRNNDKVTFKLSWELEYTIQDVVRGYRMKELKRGDKTRLDMADMIQEPKSLSTKSVVVPQLLPKFVDSSQVGSSPDPESSVSTAFLTNPFRDMQLYLQDPNFTLRTPMGLRQDFPDMPKMRFQLWKLREVCKGPDWDKVLRLLPEGNCESIVMYVFSEREFGFWLDFLSSMGSKAIYYIIMLTLSRVIRTLLRDTTLKLALTEMPYPDRLLELCHDIYAVRIAKNFDLEEDLFAKLLFLLRSPETLAMFTRKPVVKDKVKMN